MCRLPERQLPVLALCLGEPKMADSAPAAAAPAQEEEDGSPAQVLSPLADKTKLVELSESRTQLLSRVQNLRKDLQDWRGRLDTQVKTYRQELGELRTTLNTEVEQLRTEFQDLRSALKKQLDATSGLATKPPELPKLPSNA